VIRVALSARHGFAFRSTYNANCFLRNRFSAAAARVSATQVTRAVRRRLRPSNRSHHAKPWLDHASAGYAITAVQRPSPSRHSGIGSGAVPHIRRDFLAVRSFCGSQPGLVTAADQADCSEENHDCRQHRLSCRRTSKGFNRQGRLIAQG
jgi:hypothetical protein